MDIIWLGMGNMPNMGLFLIRGEYVAKYNTSSNKLIINSVRETKVNNAAGDLVNQYVLVVYSITFISNDSVHLMILL